jgi:serine/threonine-protein kinase RsbW
LKVQSHPANLAAVRKAVESYTRDQGFDEKAVAEIGLVVNEAMANVIRHAYDNKFDKPMHVSASMNGAEEITITIRDWGKGIDPSKLPAKPYNPLEPGGVGLICLKQWMDKVVFTPQPDGMLTTLVRHK